MPAPPAPATLIYNPHAGRRRHAGSLDGIVGILSRRWTVTVRPTGAPREAIGLAREAALRGDDAVFAWGGDGTVREVTEGLLGSPSALGVIPGGTFNVVALALGLPRAHPLRAAEALVRAQAAPRDAGLLGSTPFVMQATFGFDGFVVRQLSADRKARYGMAGSVLDGLRAFRDYRFPWFDVEVDGSPHRVTGAGFVNMAEYAGPFEFVPGARWDDRKGHVLLYSGRTRFAALRFGVSLALGRHHRGPHVIIHEADELVVLASPGVFGQVDGDPWHGDLPVRCRLAEDRLQVLIPDRAA